MFDLIKRPSTLLILFLSTVAMTFAFQWIAGQWGLVFLDSISSPEQAKELVNGYSAEQIQVHIWTTAVLDVLYPLAYGSFFAGIAMASFRHFGFFLALPSFLVIPVDITEGLIQIYGLTGNLDLLDWKAILTPLKFGLFFFGFAVAVIAGLRWLFFQVKSRLA